MSQTTDIGVALDRPLYIRGGPKTKNRILLVGDYNLNDINWETTQAISKYSERFIFRKK